MPEMRFEVRWPDGTRQSFYSPSLVVTDYLEPGGRYAVADFVDRAGEALGIASERVQAKYGFPCSRAAASRAAVETAAAAHPVGEVLVEAFRGADGPG